MSASVDAGPQKGVNCEYIGLGGEQNIIYKGVETSP